MARIFKRKLYDKMLAWKQEEQGKTALLIKGARRVGKSTLAESFAKAEYESHLLIDFSIAPPEVHELFRDLSNLDFLFLRLQLLYGVSLVPRKSVVIFDEVQQQPLARQAIKHLVKDGRYDYIETGSFISIRQNIKDIVIPSEETQVCLYPMDYEEFLWALGDEATMPLLRGAFEQRLSLTDAVHRRLMRDFRLYMLIGGMPQAVDAYLERQDLSYVDRVKRRIIELYDEDFLKIDPSRRASRLFRSIPQQLASNVTRFRVGGVLDANDRAHMAEEAIEAMVDSMTVNMAHHANDPHVGMAMHSSLSAYKLYLADTGLFVTMAFMDKDVTENIIYQKLLSDKLSTDMGYVYENVVSQMLLAAGNRLFYYTFAKDDKHKYEIDFLLSRGAKVSPIEVKSSGYKTHASLDAFCQKYSDRVDQRYLIYTKDLRKDGALLCLPVYMTPFL
ncbi:MAG: ATP-binding protein [Bacteroidaceae bacterium]|nr:ATP-binding protein [Bacteroidaceae bacterium]